MNLRISLVVDDDLNTPTVMVNIVGDVDSFYKKIDEW